MASLVIQEPTRAQVLAMAEGLLAQAHYALAAQLYRKALDGAQLGESLQSRVRMGLASAPSPRTQALLSALKSLEAVAPNVFVGDGIATWFKTLPFMEDARFLELTERHADLLPIPNWHWNLQVALWAAQTALAAEGDFVELGVFKGHTSLFLAEYLDFGALPRTWFLIDTFDGIPVDQVEAGWEDANARIYDGKYSEAEVIDRFARFPNVRVIKGRVPDVLADAAPPRIAFLHLDLNNPGAEIAALDALFDRLAPGGVILLDDFLWASSRAQYEVESAWFRSRALPLLPLPTGQALFIKR